MTFDTTSTLLIHKQMASEPQTTASKLSNKCSVIRTPQQQVAHGVNSRLAGRFFFSLWIFIFYFSILFKAATGFTIDIHWRHHHIGGGNSALWTNRSQWSELYKAPSTKCLSSSGTFSDDYECSDWRGTDCGRWALIAQRLMGVNSQVLMRLLLFGYVLFSCFL